MTDLNEFEIVENGEDENVLEPLEEEIEETEEEVIEDEATGDMIEPEPTPEPDRTIDQIRWEAFNLGVDHAMRMTGGLANAGHRRQMAQKAGIWFPED